MGIKLSVLAAIYGMPMNNLEEIPGETILKVDNHVHLASSARQDLIDEIQRFSSNIRVEETVWAVVVWAGSAIGIDRFLLHQTLDSKCGELCESGLPFHRTVDIHAFKLRPSGCRCNGKGQDHRLTTID